MAEYDFSALTDKEFEELVRDLLSKDLGISLRTFKKGKDKGIDVRYSSPTNINKVVVQAKHNTETGFKGLINDLKKEIPKVAKLSPGRYIIATASRDSIFVPSASANELELRWSVVPCSTLFVKFAPLLYHC